MNDYQFEDDFDPDGYRNGELDAILNRHYTPPSQPKSTPKFQNVGKPKIDLEEVDRRIHAAYDGRMERTTTYHGRFSPLTCKCKACGEEVYKRRAEGFFRGYWTFCKCSRDST